MHASLFHKKKIWRWSWKEESVDGNINLKVAQVCWDTQMSMAAPFIKKTIGNTCTLNVIIHSNNPSMIPPKSPPNIPNSCSGFTRLSTHQFCTQISWNNHDTIYSVYFLNYKSYTHLCYWCITCTHVHTCTSFNITIAARSEVHVYVQKVIYRIQSMSCKSSIRYGSLSEWSGADTFLVWRR